MAEQFFIKRGEKINGPFSVEKLQALKKAKKLKADDEISQARKGPWDRLGAVYKSILKEDRVVDTEDDVLSDEDDEFVLVSPTESSANTVPCEDCGGIVSRRAQNCPHCGAPVGQSKAVAKKEESRSTTRCPNCGSTQIGGGRAGGVGSGSCLDAILCVHV